MKATILIVNFNGAPFLERAIQSASCQTLARSNYEILVVDDGSTDNSREILERHSHEIVVLPRSHAGLPLACNAGIRGAKGQYILRLDSDDELDPTIVSRMTEVLDSRTDISMVVSDRWEIEERSGRASLISVDPRNVFSFIGPGAMVRTNVLIDIDLYNNLYWEEYDLYIRLLEKYKIFHLPLALYRYYKHATSMTADPSARNQGWKTLIAKWGIESLRRYGSSPEMEAVWTRQGSDTGYAESFS